MVEKLGDILMNDDILKRSASFLEAQKKWNEKFNSNPTTEAEAAYRKRIYAEKDAPEPMTYEEARKLFWWTAKHLRPDYAVHESAKLIYPELIKYFFDLPSIYDNSKGILILGGVGTGKSLFFKIMQQTIWNANLGAFRICPTMDVEQAIRLGSDYEDFQKGTILFDDLGAEQIDTVAYGNRVVVMAEILQLRYNKFQSLGTKTHATANKTDLEDIGKIYGTRVLDRCREMFNVIYFNWDSLRK